MVAGELYSIGYLILHKSLIVLLQKLRPTAVTLAQEGIWVSLAPNRLSVGKCGGPAWRKMLRNIAAVAMVAS